MTIGDKRVARPSLFTTYGYGLGEPQGGVVVYIHPQRRFYILGFRYPNGARFREAFYFEDRAGRPGERGSDHENDSDYEQ